MAFDASPSWSGFNYQGKVALYHALTLINAEPLETDFSDFSLMLENIEDFEIMRNGILVSIHQVKAYNSSSYGQYSDALLEITLELHKQPNLIGKIHTWKPITSKKNFQDLATSIKDDLKLLLDEHTNTDQESGSSIIEKAVSRGENKPKKAKILQAAFPTFTAKVIFDTLDSIYRGQNDALSRLESYLYEDDNKRFCDLGTINGKIKSEISKALHPRNIPNTQEQLDKTFLYFLGVIDEYIIQRHKDKQQAEKISIKFNEIIEAIKEDHEDVGLQYLAFKFKEQFTYQIDKYINDPDDYKGSEDGVICNLKETTKIILSLSPMELWRYYRTFSPHIELDHDNNTEKAMLVDLEGIRNVLIKIFHEINFDYISVDKEKYNLSYCTTKLPYNRYLPTTITNSSRPKQIEQKIIRNKAMVETLFEFKNLIYQGKNSHTFSTTSIAHTEAPPSEDEDPRSKRNDILKNISLVPISTAKAELI